MSGHATFDRPRRPAPARFTQRPRSSPAGAGRLAPRAVRDIVSRPGTDLPASVRQTMERRLGHDFAHVRIHADAEAKRAARQVGASAYAVGRHVVLDRAAGGDGEQLLQHELAHVAQQRAEDSLPARLRVAPPDSQHEKEAREAARHRNENLAPALSPSDVAVHRQEAEEEEERVPPEQQQEDWPGFSPDAEPTFRLRLDPSLQPDLAAVRIIEQMLALERIRRQIFQLPPSYALVPPPWLSPVPSLAPTPLVPAGAGPSTPRPGEAGDVLKAILRVPAVESALNRLQTDAASRARREWGQLATGERALLITHTAIIAGGALGAGLAHEETRAPLLNMVQDTPLPVPGVPGLTFQFNVTGPDQRVQFGLDVGALLPPELGFRGSD